MNPYDLYVLLNALPVNRLVPPEDTAMLILPGGGQDYRLKAAAWPGVSDTVLVAGTRGDPNYTKTQVGDLLRHDHAGKLPPWWESQGYAEHTPMQMAWAAERIAELRPTQVVISTSAYHLPRCILTFVKTWLGTRPAHQWRPDLASNPTINQFDPGESFSTGATGTSDSVTTELARIGRYQRAGDIATPDEFLRYWEG